VKMAMPAPYGIPGAGAEFLAAMGRQPMRPRHVHFLIDHPGFEQLIMQVCFEGDDYVRTDAALAVREDHIIPIHRISDSQVMAAQGMAKPFHLGIYDFKLQHVTVAKAA
jgi:protocatechuate 3,4-dioxygenase beta subunit